MFQPRALRQYAFPERFATWGLPFVWVVVFVQQMAPFLSQNVMFALTVLYVGLATSYGTSRPLSLPPELDARLRPSKGLKVRCLSGAVRAANTLCDAASASCSVFFTQNIYVAPLPYFAPLLIFAVALHCFVELQVEKLLSTLHKGRREHFGGRGFQPDEARQLVSVESIKMKSDDLL